MSENPYEAPQEAESPRYQGKHHRAWTWAAAFVLVMSGGTAAKALPIALLRPSERLTALPMGIGGLVLAALSLLVLRRVSAKPPGTH